MRKAILPYTIKMVLEDETFKKYIKKARAKPETIKSTAYALSRWCSHVNMTPTEFIKEAKLDGVKIQDVDDRRISEYLADFPDFLDSISSGTKDGKLSPTTLWMIQNNVLMFYERHKVELPFQRIPTGRTHEENRYFVDKEEVRKALEYSSVRNKAIILVQCSSGMGTAELLSIKTKQFWDGLDENGIVALKMIRKKTGQTFITFLTPEASEAVKLYLEDYDGEYLFQLTEDGLQQVYRRLSERMGYEKEYGQYSHFRSHAMRRFFNNSMFDNGRGMNKDLIWFMSGRAENATQKAYINKKVDELKELYVEHMDKVMVYSVRNITSEKVKELEAKLTSYEDKFKKLDMFDELIATTMELDDVSQKAKAFMTLQFLSDKENIKKGIPIRHPHDDRPDM